MQKDITIGDTRIHQDAAGRYCLNDLHKASGGEKKHGPSYWMTNAQTKELISELNKGGTGIPGTEQFQPVATLQGGTSQGTYVCKELVYAYAMWISPKFHLKVIRTFDAVVTGQLTPHGSDPILMLAQATQMLRQEQLAMQTQVAALETKAEALEDQAELLKSRSEHLEDWSEEQADKTLILEHETANLGNQANKMEETLKKLRGGLNHTYDLVKELKEQRLAPQTVVCLRPPTNPVTLRLHEKGYTVRSWAKEHGFDYWAVRNVISGLSQKVAVKEALEREGMLEADLF